MYATLRTTTQNRVWFRGHDKPRDWWDVCMAGLPAPLDQWCWMPELLAHTHRMYEVLFHVVSRESLTGNTGVHVDTSMQGFQLLIPRAKERFAALWHLFPEKSFYGTCTYANMMQPRGVRFCILGAEPDAGAIARLDIGTLDQLHPNQGALPL